MRHLFKRVVIQYQTNETEIQIKRLLKNLIQSTKGATDESFNLSRGDEKPRSSRFKNNNINNQYHKAGSNNLNLANSKLNFSTKPL